VSVLRETRVAVRALFKTPAFTLGALTTIALTVGATTAIFSVVHAVLLRQLPYRDADRVFWVWGDQQDRDRTPLNVPDFMDYRERARLVEDLAGYFSYGAGLSDEAAGERLYGLRATGNFFDVLGARARFGRLLRPGDEVEHDEHVVVLTSALWERRFGGDARLLGSSIRLNGEPYTVVGILEPDFVTPIRDVDFVIPFAADRDPRRGLRNSVSFIQGVGRLRSGVDVEQADAELDAIARTLQGQFPVENARKRGINLVAAIDGVAGSFSTAMITIFAAVGVVWLVACANLGNLMLTRASGRRKQIAVQLALGSSRWAVARQCLVEALVIGMAGGALGVVVAYWSMPLLVSLAPRQLPRVNGIGLSLTALLFSIATSLLTAVVFGAGPALAASRVDVRDALVASSRGATAGGRAVRGALVACEVALAVALLVTVTLLAKSFANVQSIDPGFDPDHVLSARITLPPRHFTDAEAIVTFQRALRDRVSALPGVTAQGAITLPPLIGALARIPFTVEGRVIEPENVPMAQFRIVSAGYFEALRIPVKRGRAFSDGDTAHTSPVTVVNEALAKRWLDPRDPIGTRLLVDDGDSSPARPVEVVGVVGNVLQIALDAPEPTWDIYLVYPQIHPDTIGLATANMFWFVRTGTDPSLLASAFAQEVRRVNGDVVASPIRPMSQQFDDAVGPRRFSVTLMLAFALAAMLLAVTGIYAVIACSVSQRAREFGIRAALGAPASTLVRLVMTEAARYIGAGLIAGLVLAVAAVRTLEAMLFGLSPGDPATFIEVTVIVAVAALFAAGIPSLRVVRARHVDIHSE
jgi:putative ABC transport system permease protein